MNTISISNNDPNRSMLVVKPLVYGVPKTCLLPAHIWGKICSFSYFNSTSSLVCSRAKCYAGEGGKEGCRKQEYHRSPSPSRRKVTQLCVPSDQDVFVHSESLSDAAIHQLYGSMAWLQGKRQQVVIYSAQSAALPPLCSLSKGPLCFLYITYIILCTCRPTVNNRLH